MTGLYGVQNFRIIYVYKRENKDTWTSIPVSWICPSIRLISLYINFIYVNNKCFLLVVHAGVTVASLVGKYMNSISRLCKISAMHSPNKQSKKAFYPFYLPVHLSLFLSFSLSLSLPPSLSLSLFNSQAPDIKNIISCIKIYMYTYAYNYVITYQNFILPQKKYF